MKKIILVFALLLSLAANAQFPGKYPELLLGKEIKVNQLKGKDIYAGYHFYTNPEIANKNIYLPSADDNSQTSADKVVGRTFNVENVQKLPSPKVHASLLTIKDTATGETLYTEYDDRYTFMFPFDVIGGVVLPADFYDDYIERKPDKFTGTTTYITKNQNGVTFVKIVKGAAAKYYIGINIPNFTEAKGVTVLLTGNGRIERANLQLSSFDGADNLKYTGAYFELTLKDVHLLIDNEITDTRVGDHDNEVNLGKMLKDLFGALIEKK